MFKLNRRNAIATVIGGGAAALAQTPPRPARQDLDVVKEFVIAGHSDSKMDKVKEMLDQNPKLVLASHDWGDGDWETALGGAAHMGSREMAKYLLSRGARFDAYCAAMLGHRETVRALTAANPAVVNARGPHGYMLMYHVAASGDVPLAEILKPRIDDKRHYQQALSAAVRGGQLPMTQWLFDVGQVDPNLPGDLGKRPLQIAIDKGHREIEAELRKRGAREAE